MRLGNNCCFDPDTRCIEVVEQDMHLLVGIGRQAGMAWAVLLVDYRRNSIESPGMATVFSRVLQNLMSQNITSCGGMLCA